MKVQIINRGHQPLPAYATPQSAGMDLRANIDESIVLHPMDRQLVPTGLFMAFALVVPEVIKIMGGETYYGSEKLVLLLLLGIYAIFMYSFPVNFKTYQKRTLSIAVGTIIASIINVVVCIVLTTKLSFWGTSIAIVVAYLTLFLIHQFTIRSKKNNTDLYVYGFKFFVPGFLLALVSCGLSYVLLEHMLIRWIVAFTIGFALLGKIIKQKNIF